MGALLDAKQAHPNRSARNHLRWIAATNRIAVTRVDEVLDMVGLGSAADDKAGTLSLGMSQRLGIAVNAEQWMCWTYHRRLCPRFCAYVDRVFEVFVPLNAAIVTDFADVIPGVLEMMAALSSRGGCS